jgi:antitoxin PrlF
MHEFETRMTAKGQVTIPRAIRIRLGLKQGDRVRFVLEEDRVVVQPAPSRVLRHFGIAQAPQGPVEVTQERAAFEQAVAADVRAETEAPTEGCPRDFSTPISCCAI